MAGRGRGAGQDAAREGWAGAVAPTRGGTSCPGCAACWLLPSGAGRPTAIGAIVAAPRFACHAQGLVCRRLCARLPALAGPAAACRGGGLGAGDRALARGHGAPLPGRRAGGAGGGGGQHGHPHKGAAERVVLASAIGLLRGYLFWVTQEAQAVVWRAGSRAGGSGTQRSRLGSRPASQRAEAAKCRAPPRRGGSRQRGSGWMKLGQRSCTRSSWPTRGPTWRGLGTSGGGREENRLAERSRGSELFVGRRGAVTRPLPTDPDGRRRREGALRWGLGCALWRACSSAAHAGSERWVAQLQDIDSMQNCSVLLKCGQRSEAAPQQQPPHL